MRRIIAIFTILLISGVWLNVAEASIARGGGGARPAVGNRSVGGAGANINRGNFNTGNINRGSVNTSNVDRSNINRNSVNTNVNRSVNNVNVNRDVDVHGWGNNYWVDDNHWGWGSFAAGAAVGATSAAVGAAAASSHYPVVAPETGVAMTTLPAGCMAVENTEPPVYDCGGAYYQPSYAGSSVVYQGVPQPY